MGLDVIVQPKKLDKPSQPIIKGNRGTITPNAVKDNRITMAMFGIFYTTNNAAGGKIKRAKKKDL